VQIGHRHEVVHQVNRQAALQRAACSIKLPQRFERHAELGDEELRLFPSREVAAFVELVVMDEFGIRTLCPTPRGCIDLVWKDAHGHRDGDVFDVEKARARG
jgi:hypothetical protein